MSGRDAGTSDDQRIKALHPGKPFSPGQIRMMGHLLLESARCLEPVYPK